MSKNQKILLIFLGSGAAMFLIFFFYPAEIFDVNYVGQLAETEDEVSLKVFLGMDESVNNALSLSNIEMKRTLSGWMIMFICFIGLPAMIAYRSVLTKTNKEETANEERED